MTPQKTPSKESLERARKLFPPMFLIEGNEDVSAIWHRLALELDTLESKLKAAKLALEPFAKWGEYIDGGGYSFGNLVFSTTTGSGELKVTVSDLRRASEALAALDENKTSEALQK